MRDSLTYGNNMKILIIQANGSHEENKEYRECKCMERTLIELGVEATCWGKGHPNFDDKINFNSYDVIFCLENYDDGWLPNLSNYKKPLKIYYAIDPHVRGAQPYIEIYQQKGFDKLFSAIESYCGPETVFFPPGVDEKLFYNKNLERDINFGYVGSYCTYERLELLQHVERKFKLDIHEWVLGDKMVDLLNRFKISFNKNISNDVNYRNFESISCGALLMTSYNENLATLGFKHGENCLIYKNKEEIMDFFPLKKEKMKAIAKAGEELAKKHTYKKRCESLLRYLEKEV